MSYFYNIEQSEMFFDIILGCMYFFIITICIIIIITMLNTQLTKQSYFFNKKNQISLGHNKWFFKNWMVVALFYLKKKKLL